MTLLKILKRDIMGEDGTEKMELSVAGLNAVMRLPENMPLRDWWLMLQ